MNKVKREGCLPFSFRSCSVLLARGAGMRGSDVPWPMKNFMSFTWEGTCIHQNVFMITEISTPSRASKQEQKVIIRESDSSLHAQGEAWGRWWSRLYVVITFSRELSREWSAFGPGQDILWTYWARDWLCPAGEHNTGRQSILCLQSIFDCHMPTLQSLAQLAACR